MDKNGLQNDYIISIEDLCVSFKTILGTSYALDGVSMKIPRSKVLGVVGESGCGKSVTGLSIMQIVPPPGRIDTGKIQLWDSDEEKLINLLEFDRYGPEMRAIRGNRIAMIFQEPMTSLNPCFTIGDQIVEAVELHTRNQVEVKSRALEILKRVEMPNPEQVFKCYPHELSGGMRQRAMIAMALSCRPQLLIADEPTTALDVTTEGQILSLMRELQAAFGMSIMYITHNMGVIAQMADRVVVMYLGKVVEEADVRDLFYNPKHPYTISLLRSIPRMGKGHRGKLESIKGMIPDPYTRISGCPFHPRCPSFIHDVCNRLAPDISWIDADRDHYVRCHCYD